MATTLNDILYALQNGVTAINNLATKLVTTTTTGIPNDTVLGNVSGVPAAPTALTSVQLTTLVNLFGTAGPGAPSGAVPGSSGGAVNFLRADGAWSPTAVASGGGTVTGFDAGAGITLTPNPITSSGRVSLSNIASNTVLGNVAAAGPPTALSTTQLTTLVNLFTIGGLSGAVAGSSGGTVNFLRADDTWASPTPTIANNTVLGNVSGASTLAVALSTTQLTTLINPFTTGGLSGGVVGSSGGTVNFLRADDTWNNPIPTIANDTVLGNVSGGSTFATALSTTQLTSLINLFQSSVGGTLSGAVPPSGGGTVNFLRADGTWSGPPGAAGGTVTGIDAGNGITLTPNPITSSGRVSLAVSSNNTVMGNVSGVSTSPYPIGSSQLTPLILLFGTSAAGSPSGAVAGSSGGTTNFLRADDTWAAPPAGTITVLDSTRGISLSPATITSSGTIFLTAISNNSVLGNVSGGSTSPTGLSTTQLTGLINLFGTSAATAPSGATPGSSGGTTNFLRADGTWTTPTVAPGGGTVTAIGPGTGITVTPNPITSTGNISLASVSSNTVLGNVGAAGPPTPLSTTQLTTLINTFTTGGLSGAVIGSSGGTVNFLRADDTWSNPTPFIANNTVLGNVSGGSTFATALSTTQLTTLINLFTTGGLSGATPGSSGGSLNFLRADGTWNNPFNNNILYPSGGNDSTIITNSLSSGGLTSLGSGTFRADTAIAFPVNTNAWLAGAGTGITTISVNSTTANGITVANTSGHNATGGIRHLSVLGSSSQGIGIDVTYAGNIPYGGGWSLFDIAISGFKTGIRYRDSWYTFNSNISLSNAGTVSATSASHGNGILLDVPSTASTDNSGTGYFNNIQVIYPAALFLGYIGSGGIPNTTLTVTSTVGFDTYGPIRIGYQVTGGLNMPFPWPVVTGFITGTGGAGTYALDTAAEIGSAISPVQMYARPQSYGIEIKSDGGSLWNQVEEWGGQRGLVVQPSSYTNVFNQWLSNFVMDTNSEYGELFFTSSGTGTIDEIFGSMCWGVWNSIVGLVVDGSSGNPVKNVQMVGGRWSNNAFQGVSLTYGHNVEIHDADIIDNSYPGAGVGGTTLTWEGIGVRKANQHVRITGNYVGADSSASPTQASGIIVDAGDASNVTNYVIIANNDLSTFGAGAGLTYSASGANTITTPNLT